MHDAGMPAGRVALAWFHNHADPRIYSLSVAAITHRHLSHRHLQRDLTIEMHTADLSLYYTLQLSPTA